MNTMEPIHQRHFLINGRLEEWSGPVQEVFSPIEERPIGSYPMLTAEESKAALQAAVSAYDRGRGDWPTMTVADRIRHLEQFTYQMVEQRELVAHTLMWEVGKTRSDSYKEFDRTIEYINDTIDALKDLDRVSSRFVLEKGILAQIRRAPLGVVLCMGPYNYPLNETFTTLIPALVMGNTVVIKAPKMGVLLHQPLLQAFRDCFPAGVVNTVYGDGVVTVGPLMASGQVDVLAFIGSTRVADLLKQQHPNPHRLRCVLGLGAKNPAIILADADLEHTVAECVKGSLSFNGQRCTALKILFVQREIAEDFTRRLAEAVAKVHVGMPWEDGAFITPLPDPSHIEYLQDLLRNALEEGAVVCNPEGGTRRGSLMKPAVLAPVSSAMRLYHEEQFGPLVPVVPFDEIDEPIAYVEGSPYGQQVALFGRDPEVLARLIDPLVNQVCRVNLNSQCQRGPDSFPFTGRKDSAEGTLSVTDALRVFSIRTLVAAAVNPENKAIINDIVRQRRSNFLSTDFIL
jgi:glyceraldehyde-3-phosphate dehydrogenase (NADP+)